MKKLLLLATIALALGAAISTPAQAGSRWTPGTSYYISEDDATSFLEKAFDHVYCDGVPRFGHRGDEFRRFDCDIFDSRFDCTVRVRAVKGTRPGFFRLRMGWAASHCY